MNFNCIISDATEIYKIEYYMEKLWFQGYIGKFVCIF